MHLSRRTTCFALTRPSSRSLCVLHTSHCTSHANVFYCHLLKLFLYCYNFVLVLVVKNFPTKLFNKITLRYQIFTFCMRVDVLTCICGRAMFSDAVCNVNSAN
jgi:hypothetical protein